MSDINKTNDKNKRNLKNILMTCGFFIFLMTCGLCNLGFTDFTFEIWLLVACIDTQQRNTQPMSCDVYVCVCMKINVGNNKNLKCDIDSSCFDILHTLLALKRVDLT